MTADGLTVALEDYQRAQDELVAARNRLASAIARRGHVRHDPVW